MMFEKMDAVRVYSPAHGHEVVGIITDIDMTTELSAAHPYRVFMEHPKRPGGWGMWVSAEALKKSLPTDERDMRRVLEAMVREGMDTPVQA